MSSMPGIIFDGTTSPTVDSDNAGYYLEFDKTEEYFSFIDNRVYFYKKAEKMVRKHKFIQSIYPKYLREVVGLNTCQLMPEIDTSDSKKVKIEMHHGPILTLFDVVEIVTDHMRATGHKHINVFTVANAVVEEHRLNHIQVMFLSKSVHKKVHDEGIYINYRQGFGDLDAFLDKYYLGVSPDMKMKINDYIGWSMSNDSSDSGIFQIADKMRRWGNNDFDEYLNNS